MKTKYRERCISRLSRSSYVDYGKYIEIRSYLNPVLSSHTVFSRGLKRRKGKKSLSSLYRSRSEVRRLILSNFSSGVSMLTITFSGDISFPDSKKAFNLFIKRLNYALGFNSKYVWVAEKTKRGRVHYHVLFFGVRFHSIVSSCPFPFGFTFYTPCLDNPFYISKYLSKSNDFVYDLNSRIWGCSRGLFRAKKIKVPFFLDGSLFGSLKNEYVTPYGCYQLFERCKNEKVTF